MNRFIAGLKVDLPNPRHILWRDLLQWPVYSVSRVTDENVETSELFKALLNDGPSLTRHAEIARLKDRSRDTLFAAGFSDLGQPLLPAGHQEEFTSWLGISVGSSLSDTRRSSCDKDPKHNSTRLRLLHPCPLQYTW